MNVVIVGANRGIGLEYCKQYKMKGADVYALCRVASRELNDLDVNIYENVDVADEALLQKVSQNFEDRSIDILICNAGILRDESLSQLNISTISEQFEVNTLGPLRAVKCFLNKMKNPSKIGLMTSKMGSMADNTSGGRYGYRMSKAALNAAGKSLAFDLAPKNISVAILHPGYVRTDMTGGSGLIDVDESVSGLIKCIDGLDGTNSGTFWHTNGEVIPW